MDTWTIVGYQFQADLYCGRCAIDALLGTEDAARYWVAGHGDVENIFDNLARARRIDREDEYSFDSDDFPKVVFYGDVLEDGENCGTCGCELG